MELFAGLVASTAHDVGHTGKANNFHVSTRSPLALLYNDQSCLENMHSAIASIVLTTESANFLSQLCWAEKTKFRSILVHMILNTDLGKHIQTVSHFRQEFLCASPGKESEETPEYTPSQRKEILAFVLKSSDVSGSCKSFEHHVQWTCRILTEFFNQGDVERDLGLPCSPFCGRYSTKVAESQNGFFNFIVRPLYGAFEEFLGSRRVHLEVLPEVDKNSNFWKRYAGSDFNYDHPMTNVDKLLRAYSVMFGRRGSGCGGTPKSQGTAYNMCSEDEKAGAITLRKSMRSPSQ